MCTLPTKSVLHIGPEGLFGTINKFHHNQHMNLITGMDIRQLHSNKTFDYSTKPNDYYKSYYSNTAKNLINSEIVKDHKEKNSLHQTLENLNLDNKRKTEMCNERHATKGRLCDNSTVDKQSTCNKTKMTDKCQQTRAANTQQTKNNNKGKQKSKKGKKCKKREGRNKNQKRRNKSTKSVEMQEKIDVNNGYPKHESVITQVCAIAIPSPIVIASDAVDGCYSPKQKNIRSRFPSECDSDDSFIIFSDIPHTPSNSAPLKLNVIGNISISFLQSRTHLSSECESEDSFIVFDDSSRSICQDSIVYDSLDDDSDDGLILNGDCEFTEKKVRFASQENLCEIHPMVQWSYAYQKARKGPWEQYALDRVRFQNRILKCQPVLDRIFEPAHRNKIYKERFAELD